jgi:hypothetical protein
MQTAKLIQTITINDPEGGEVEVDIFKHSNGGIFGLDASYIDQELNLDDDEPIIIPDPFASEKYKPLELLDL